MDVYALTRKTRPTNPTMGPMKGPTTSPSTVNTKPEETLPPLRREASQIALHNHPGNPPKSPMYRPAALRQSSYRPPTLRDLPTMANYGSYTAPPSPTPSDSSSKTIGHRPTVTPMREHWKPDSAAQECAASTCHIKFGVWDRRHHCRRCGDIFCAQHSRATVRLDESAMFHDEGVMSRACPRCAREWDSWRRSQNVPTPSPSSAGTTGGPADQVAKGGKVEQLRRHTPTRTMSEGPMTISRQTSERSEASEDQANQMPMPSVPQDWVWSTF
ncbi:hypothetical protein SAICODRAFT_5733 [Saitoella complicata NRRL Y-17804]|uniref:uncharacterized protein n=1 Tax=Saitoella complicata (strain BCRC 22490 / CBS 7301 / JCM 7358 / NBRC 10748 / NRRL Y-17804) TaxID=698492 RepID=UPI000867A3C1|nr:uncharacterized protein SAICODRAFT_5733 [Saitoella complicata NRRL Y-17804]ODQ55133.1 hypothetical protein SAICODRAFT_5733 [Saitoella complicata NRRL Y-17804]